VVALPACLPAGLLATANAAPVDVSPPPNTHLAAGRPGADFALADTKNLDVTYANAGGRNFGLTVDGAAYASTSGSLFLS
jgi:hypothetical protein